jgi:hypothetical protein
MKLKQTGKIAPASKPWKLLHDALDDLEKQERCKKTVAIDMNVCHGVKWHGTSTVCHQCLAGCMLSRRLGVDTRKTVYFDEFPGYHSRFRALDLFRKGMFQEAYYALGLKLPSEIPSAVIIPWYDLYPYAFKSQLRYWADRMKEVHDNGINQR